MGTIFSLEDFFIQVSKIKKKGKIVLAGGCFDIFHNGHAEFLKMAKAQGDTLIILLESDESIKKRKGDDRPVNTQNRRAEKLSKNVSVDFVILLPLLKTDLEYYNLVKKLEPDIIAVTKNDPAYNKKVEQAGMVGGKVVEVINRLPYSTTDLHSRKNLPKKQNK